MRHVAFRKRLIKKNNREVKYSLKSDNWIVQNLNNALETWNSKLSEIWQLLTQSPETFKGGDIWHVMLTIHDALKGIGYPMQEFAWREQSSHLPVLSFLFLQQVRQQSQTAVCLP